MSIGSDPLARLPEEVSLNIFSFLDSQDLAQCSQVNTLWHILANDDSLWERFLQESSIPLEGSAKERFVEMLEIANRSVEIEITADDDNDDAVPRNFTRSRHLSILAIAGSIAIIIAGITLYASDERNPGINVMVGGTACLVVFEAIYYHDLRDCVRRR